MAAFLHYPHGNVPKAYRCKVVVSETFGGAKVFRLLFQRISGEVDAYFDVCWFL